MKAIEFQTKLHSSDSIEIPADYQGQLRSEQEVRVIVLIDDNGQDPAWNKLTTKQFFSGYSGEDSIYDNMP